MHHRDVMMCLILRLYSWDVARGMLLLCDSACIPQRSQSHFISARQTLVLHDSWIVKLVSVLKFYDCGLFSFNWWHNSRLWRHHLYSARENLRWIFNTHERHSLNTLVQIKIIFFKEIIYSFCFHRQVFKSFPATNFARDCLWNKVAWCVFSDRRSGDSALQSLSHSLAVFNILDLGGLAARTL